MFLSSHSFDILVVFCSDSSFGILNHVIFLKLKKNTTKIYSGSVHVTFHFTFMIDSALI